MIIRKTSHRGTEAQRRIRIFSFPPCPRAPVRCLFINVLMLVFTVFFLASCSKAPEEAPATAEELVVEEQSTEASTQSTEDTLIVEASLEIPVLTPVEAEEEPAPEGLSVDPFPEPRFAIVPPSARPGEPVTVGISGESGSGEASGGAA